MALTMTPFSSLCLAFVGIALPACLPARRSLSQRTALIPPLPNHVTLLLFLSLLPFPPFVNGPHSFRHFTPTSCRTPVSRRCCLCCVLAGLRVCMPACPPLPSLLSLSHANGPIDHMPPVMYEFEIACAQRGERRHSVYKQVMASPINPLGL